MIPTIMRVIGGAILAIIFFRMIFIGKAYHGRIFGAPLFMGSGSDFMRKMDSSLKWGLVGGGLFLLSYWVEEWLP